MRYPLPLLTRETRPLRLHAANTCLLLQDVHAPFVDTDQGWLAERAHAKVLDREFDEYFDSVRLILPQVGRLLEVARHNGLSVAYACLGFQLPKGPSGFQLSTGWAWDLDGRDGRFAPALAPRVGEPIFAKPAWGALAAPGLVGFLADRRVENVILVGSLVEFGLRQTCYELMDLGIGTLVVADAVSALTEAGRASAVGSMAHGLVKVRSYAETADLLAVMREEGTVLI